MTANLSNKHFNTVCTNKNYTISQYSILNKTERVLTLDTILTVEMFSRLLSWLLNCFAHFSNTWGDVVVVNELLNYITTWEDAGVGKVRNITARRTSWDELFLLLCFSSFESSEMIVWVFSFSFSFVSLLLSGTPVIFINCNVSY